MFALHESGKITRRSYLPEEWTEIESSPRKELTEEQLQELHFDWKRGRVWKTASYKEPTERPWLTDKNYFAYIKHLEPKKGKTQTALHTIAEFGKKIVPAKLRGRK